MRLRIALGAAGILLGLFGIFRLLTQIGGSDLITLFIWLAAAVVLHDAVLSPILLGVGWAVTRTVPPRARRYLAFALVVGAMITVIALPEIHKENSQPASKAILQESYGRNLVLVLAVIAAAAVLAYAVRIVRDRAPRPRAANDRPPADDQTSSTV